MKVKDIFEKPIDRPIEGVIKADDLDSLALEVEEYVITNEIAKSLQRFFGDYNEYQGANGVWISGFFGSGKSHLLKMLALLLENQQLERKTILEYFLPKCSNDAMLKAEMKKAAEIPSRSILFNIDQKADTISKTEVDALLAVFSKVFNEMCGYYGKQGYVAQFERDLDNRGLYSSFKEEYQLVAKKPWEQGREAIILEKGHVATAYAKVSGTTEEGNKNIIDAYRNDYKLSIEDFADQVSEYIQKQEPGFRLNFFVDEVGQYIADNVKLMTNLQTIAESLATKCKGRAWLIVTAQADMDTVLGEMGRQMTNDFSKIQDRFKIRLKLTSQNVDDVIQRRLLAKNEVGAELSRGLYEKEKNNFGTIFTFTDGAATYRNFVDETHFVNCYPFIPYQFTLFQSAIENLSAHNAFEGKHSSVGERSMLGVFQEVAKEISAMEVGQLATFDLMFNGIEKTLKPYITSSFYKAKNNLEHPLATRVLQVLLLVKYIKGFNATSRNLRVLLQETFTQDITILKRDIEEALDLLERQTYIQRNGDVFEYLTDEEKDIEEEIKNTDVDSGDLVNTLDDLLFTEILRDRKIRYETTGQDYAYTKKLDDRTIGREHELTIHFVTPFSENVDRLDILKANSLGRAELMIVLPPDVRLILDLNHYKKTEKYIRTSRSTRQSDAILSILDTKARQNSDRLKAIQDQLRALVSQARFFVSGQEVEISGEEPKSRIVKGFQELIVGVYLNLGMLRGTSFTETDIKKHLQIAKDALLAESLSEPEQELLAFVQANKRVGIRTTLKSIEDKFSKKPYGWYLAAIQCLTAMLLGRGKVEARIDSNILESADLERALTNTHGFGNVIIDLQSDITQSELRQAKDIFSSLFDRPATANEARALGLEFRAALDETLTHLREMHARVSQFPFLVALEDSIHQLEELSRKEYSFYFSELPKRATNLLDMKEDVIDPIRQFMAGSSKDIYREAWQYLQDNSANFSGLQGDAHIRLAEILKDPHCYRGNHMKEAKVLLDGLKKDVEKHLSQTRKQALQQVEQLHEKIRQMDEYALLDEAQKQEIGQSLEAIERYIQTQPLVAVIRDRAGQYETADYNNLLTKIANWTQSSPDTAVEIVSLKELGVKFEKPYLTSEEDVEAYLEAVKKAMLKAIKLNKRIQL